MDKLKTMGLQVFVLHLKVIYFFLKLLPSKIQVVFISRQSSVPSTDFELLIAELNKCRVPVVVLCKEMEKNKLGYLKYYFHILKQLFVMARSQVCVIDTYIIPVSVLNHKPNFKVIQIWHAIGKIKKSGYQTLGKAGGRDEVLSRALKMNQNYDYIVAGAQYWNPYYCQSFNVTEDKLKNFGLPRMDYLLEKKADLQQEIRSKYPILDNGKKNILYAPTFRRTRSVGISSFLKDFDYENCNLILKFHPHDVHKEEVQDDRILFIEEYSATQLLPLAEYLVTDYSSIAFEAALIDLKTLFYLNDYDKYLAENGLNLDLKQAVPSLVTLDGEQIHESINTGNYDFQTFRKFKQLVLPKELGKSTKNIVTLIEELL